MQTQDKQRYPTLEEWAKHGYKEENFENVMHKTEVRTIEVNANRLEMTAYKFYVTDPLNLKRPIAFSVTVMPDGKLEFFHAEDEDPEEALNNVTTVEEAWRIYEEEEIILELTGHRQLSQEEKMVMGDQVLETLHKRGVISTPTYEKEKEQLHAWIKDIRQEGY